MIKKSLYIGIKRLRWHVKICKICYLMLCCCWQLMTCLPPHCIIIASFLCPYFIFGWNHEVLCRCQIFYHYRDVIMSGIASQITGLSIVYSTVYSGADQRTYQSSVSMAFARGIHRCPVNSPHKRPVTRKMFPFDNVLIASCILIGI